MLYCMWTAKLAHVKRMSINLDLSAAEVGRGEGEKEGQQGSGCYSISVESHGEKSEGQLK